MDTAKPSFRFLAPGLARVLARVLAEDGRRPAGTAIARKRKMPLAQAARQNGCKGS